MREQLPDYLANAVPDTVDLWPQVRRRVARRRWGRIAAQLVSAAAALAMVVGAGFVFSHAPRTPVNAQTILEKAREALPGSVQSLAGHSDMGTVVWDRWYQAPNWSRTEIYREGKLESVTVLDGTSMWEYLPQDRSLLIYPISMVSSKPYDVSHVLRTDQVAEVLQSVGTCYSPRVAEVERTGTRTVYVIALGEPRCEEQSEAGWRTLWIDGTSYQVLKMAGSKEQIEFNPTLPADRFQVEPPPETRVTDIRPGGDATTADLVSQLVKVGGPVGFPLFFVQNPPPGLAPVAPVWTPAGFEFTYVGAGKSVHIIQRMAVASDVARRPAGYERIAVGGRLAWFMQGLALPRGETMASSLQLVRDGTYIGLSSYDLSRDELVRVAESLRMVPQDRPRTTTNPEPLSLSVLRSKVGFPVLVPDVPPAGLTRGQPFGGDGFLITVTIPYSDGKEDALLVTSGPAGCCLDADSRKLGESVTIRGGITAHLLNIDPPILWWNENGAYV
ncbi:MAG TPA: hypothetical protein VNT75_27195, partial [Symbiobacteriaceae bacterium]|nr:hypothetical protein [Symbiobacteriaceae bacterium]